MPIAWTTDIAISGLTPSAAPSVVRLTTVTCLLLTACAKRETAVEAGIRTQTLHFGNDVDPESLDPHALGGTSANPSR